MLCDYLTNSTMELTTTWSLLVNFCWFHPEISQQCQHGIIPPLLHATVLELPENHSVPEKTTDLRSHGQLESIDFLNLNHFIRQGFRSPRRATDGELRSHWYIHIQYLKKQLLLLNLVASTAFEDKILNIFLLLNFTFKDKRNFSIIFSSNRWWQIRKIGQISLLWTVIRLTN